MTKIKQRTFFIDFQSELDHSMAYFVGILNDTRLTTIQTVQKLTTKDLDWQYRKGWNTVGALLSHISALEHYFRIVYIEKRAMTTEEDSELIPALDMGIHLPSLISGKNIVDYINELTISRNRLLDSLSVLTFEDFSKILKNTDYGENCNLAWILFHLIEDEIYHRGQISMLLKIMQDTDAS